MVIDSMAAYMAERRKERRWFLINYLGGKCVQCDRTENLHIDHINPDKKLLSLSGKGLDGAWNKILEEVKKCQLLCEKHHIEKNIYDGLAGGYNKIEAVCGTAHAYTKNNCRCKPCKKAKKLYRNGLIGYHDLIPG